MGEAIDQEQYLIYFGYLEETALSLIRYPVLPIISYTQANKVATFLLNLSTPILAWILSPELRNYLRNFKLHLAGLAPPSTLWRTVARYPCRFQLDRLLIHVGSDCAFAVYRLAKAETTDPF